MSMNDLSIPSISKFARSTQTPLSDRTRPSTTPGHYPYPAHAASTPRRSTNTTTYCSTNTPSMRSPAPGSPGTSLALSPSAPTPDQLTFDLNDIGKTRLKDILTSPPKKSHLQRARRVESKLKHSTSSSSLSAAGIVDENAHVPWHGVEQLVDGNNYFKIDDPIYVRRYHRTDMVYSKWYAGHVVRPELYNSDGHEQRRYVVRYIDPYTHEQQEKTFCPSYGEITGKLPKVDTPGLTRKARSNHNLRQGQGELLASSMKGPRTGAVIYTHSLTSSDQGNQISPPPVLGLLVSHFFVKIPAQGPTRGQSVYTAAVSVKTGSRRDPQLVQLTAGPRSGSYIEVNANDLVPFTEERKKHLISQGYTVVGGYHD